MLKTRNLLLLRGRHVTRCQCESAHERLFLPKHIGILLIPVGSALHTVANFHIKLEQETSKDELSLTHGHELTQTVPRAEGKGAPALTVVAAIGRVIEPTLRDKAVGIAEVIGVTVGGVVVDRDTSSTGDGASRHLHP